MFYYCFIRIKYKVLP